MPLKIYTSNRMENLVVALADVVAKPLASPFTPESIVVQSKGMQRWLAMELAGRLGVWANCTYPFPNKMVWQLFCNTLPNIPDVSSFSPDVMSWKIVGLLPGLIEREEFAPLRHYLSVDSDGLKRFQLAGKIADTFDQYTLFRPEMLLEWEKSNGGDWQEILWRELTTCGGGQHRARLKLDFSRLLNERQRGEENLPERITVFGISYLPQYHMDILAEVAERTEVNLFLLSPCREYWGDIVSVREMTRLGPKDRDYRVEGNPLLASLGKVARDFSNTVVSIGSAAVIDLELYGDPGEEVLLTAIQSDILNLSGSGDASEKRLISSGDRSVQIHSCHSPMREIEVLHDNLLDLLEREKGLYPRDIVVMTPDIETYAPYITTVFEGGQDAGKKIPYSIADRSISCEGEIAAVLLKLLALSSSRLTVPQLLDILASVPVSRRFDLGDDELDTVRRWLEETRVRWGMDERDRERFGLPGYRENSWRAGLDRLFLGYAMPDEGNLLFNNILPYDEMEGDGPRTLGKITDFIERVADFSEQISRSRTLAEWRDLLRTLLAEFVAVDDNSAHELAAVTGVVEQLAELQNAAAFSEKVELDVIRSWIESRLDKEEKGSGFMTGGVTFCAMLPMRSIPFRVVALIGMNDGAFPRQSRSPGFDLIARNPRSGDRSLRDEDRYLFLEALLSARDCFYLSYVGQSIKDNSEIPPSVLVSELLDAIERVFTPGDESNMETRLVTRHRLQAFSRDYFDARSPLFSYSAENCAALLDRRDNPWQPREFLSAPIAVPSVEWKDVPLAKLLRFFDNPCRFLLENRLGIRLEDAATPLEEREPFSLDGLEAYGIKQELLEISLGGGDVGSLFAIARCRGILPPSLHGEKLFATAVGEVTDFADTVQEKLAGQSTLSPLDFDIQQGEYHLTGRLDRIWTERMIRYRCAKMKAKDRIRSWLEHVVLNAAWQEGYPRETLLLMTDTSISYKPVENVANILQTVLDLYWEGLTMPLRFFPASSLEYARKLEWKLERARTRWEEGYNTPGEGDDPYYWLCFGQMDPFNDDFERVSRTLLEPLLRHLA
jgi:exodeoxyribonuclease V gamma subunit